MFNLSPYPSIFGFLFVLGGFFWFFWISDMLSILASLDSFSSFYAILKGILRAPIIMVFK